MNIHAVFIEYQEVCGLTDASATPIEQKALGSPLIQKWLTP